MRDKPNKKTQTLNNINPSVGSHLISNQILVETIKTKRINSIKRGESDVLKGC